MIFTLAFSLIFLVIGWATYAGLKGVPWFLPVKLFIFFNGVMGLGILFALDFNDPADIAHGAIVLVSALVYGLSSIYFSSRFSLSRNWHRFFSEVDIGQRKGDFYLSIALYAISGVAVCLYFYLVGYNVILTSLTSSLSASDVKDLRLASYAGDDYYAPGYFNQFKNILFPIAFLALSFNLKKRIKSRKIFVPVVIVLMAPVILGLMGTGQRAFLVGFVIVSMVFLAIASSRRFVIKRAALVAIALVFVFLFSISSYLLGRSEDFSIGSSLEALAVRLFSDNQISALVGFRYIYEQAVQFGGEWLTDILGILPGEYKGSDLANRVHALLYGSDRGTSPVSLWGSVYYNWGWFGIFLFPPVLSFAYCIISKRFLKRTNHTSLEIAGYAFLFYILGAWIASGPMQLVNNGLVACVLLIFGLRFQRGWRGRGFVERN
ncbi:oligosaccharide repeat unit polymerase [Variovorax sp. Root318D1]|uniref:oligosaccharide repeat unit polymerase n=1 Tax=Variovorax sp. Root318D1 TaxID=1736513 RepID=UPI0009EBABDA|nr:oligosaccharide repeat unit polymerase [Variovorax sp. Root318D1]